MCEQESHQTLSQPEHFTRHAIEVKRGCAAHLGRGLGEAGLHLVMVNAREALELEPTTVTDGCHQMLAYAALGDMEQAAARPKLIKLT